MSSHPPPTKAPPSRAPAIAHASCDTQLHSIVSATSLHLVFANRTPTRVTIYWLDFNGERVKYNALEPGESYSQQTYVTHPWLIVDADGRCLDVLVPQAAGTFAVPIR